MTETVSVVIPAYDSGRYVAAAVESVLTQTAPPDEVIVVDDGSTDATAAIVERLGAPVRLVRERHQGYACAVNRGVAEASGSLLAFQDADDLWMPDKLEHQRAALDATPGLDAVFGHLESFVSPELPAEHARRYRVPPVMPCYQPAALLVRRGSFDRVGPLDARSGTGVVLDWVSRARAAGVRMRVLDAVVVRRRIHDANIGVRVGDERDHELLDALRSHRRRMGRSGNPGG